MEPLAYHDDRHREGIVPVAASATVLRDIVRRDSQKQRSRWAADSEVEDPGAVVLATKAPERRWIHRMQVEDRHLLDRRIR